jgi:hypothetical protein
MLPLMTSRWHPFPTMRLQQALAAVGQEHRHVPLTGHPSSVDEAQFAEVAELGVPSVQRPRP